MSNAINPTSKMKTGSGGLLTVPTVEMNECVLQIKKSKLGIPFWIERKHCHVINLIYAIKQTKKRED